MIRVSRSIGMKKRCFSHLNSINISSLRCKKNYKRRSEKRPLCSLPSSRYLVAQLVGSESLIRVLRGTTVCHCSGECSSGQGRRRVSVSRSIPVAVQENRCDG